MTGLRQVADNVWNYRGVFRMAGVIDVGTQMSLIRRADGRFLLIDSYALEGGDRDHLLRLTRDGSAIDAILNVHPFHTLHCRAAHEMAPSARLIGTRRHRLEAPELPWDDALVEDETTKANFPELDFTMPAGLDLVTEDDRVHAASVMVRHRASGVVHVDDTLNVLTAPGPLKALLPQSRLRFHPMLGKALTPRAGAADAFAAWARDLAGRWSGTPTVCAAHSAVRSLPEDGWRDELTRALTDVEPTLNRHREQYG